MVRRKNREADFQDETEDNRVLLKVAALSTLALLALVAGIAFPQNNLLLLLSAAFIAMVTATLFLAGRLGAELAGINGGDADLDSALVRVSVTSSRSYEQ
ncbi:hypothetical protein [uncultured Roseibium sp.]|uniref:hypothetical protein n=1 Tax=uncultured Roseibium sp. TaxID=1936171 RepID=UPI0032167797